MTKPKDVDNSGNFTFKNHTRDVIVLIVISCLSMVIANSTVLNFTVICMKQDLKEVYLLNLTELMVQKLTPMYTDKESSWLFSAVAMGAILGTWPMATLNFKYGARKTFTAYGTLSALATFALPYLTQRGFYAVFTSRFIVGISFAMTLPATGIVVADWASIKRAGTYVALLSMHLQFGSIVAMPLSGMFCASPLGWQAVYYCLGLMTAFWFGVFYFFYRDSPEMHHNVSLKELKKIQAGKVKCNRSCGTEEIPYKKIIMDPTVIASLLCTLGSRVGFQVFALYGPMYLSKVLHLDLRHTGFAVAFPSLLALVVKFFVGPASDKLTTLSAKNRVRLFATISQLLMGCCFIGLALLSEGQVWLGQALFTGVTVFNGINAVGCTKSMQLIGGRYVSVLMSFNSYINSVSVLLIPHLITLFAPNGRLSEWSHILMAIGILVTACVLIFDIFAAAERRKWALELPVMRKCGQCNGIPGDESRRGSTVTVVTTISAADLARLQNIANSVSLSSMESVEEGNESDVDHKGSGNGNLDTRVNTSQSNHETDRPVTFTR